MVIFIAALREEFSPLAKVEDGLIQRIASGDGKAFRQLYEIASAGVYGFALSITKNTYDAEDVLQDTFLTVHRAASGYEPMGKPMAWILTIARNCALSQLRKAGKAGEAGEFQEEDSRLGAVEDRALIETLFSVLDGEERQIVMLHAVSGLKNREIAALLELPLNTVLSKYHRAMKKLREKGEREEVYHE